MLLKARSSRSEVSYSNQPEDRESVRYISSQIRGETVSNKLFIFDNSLRKIASNLKGFGKGMLQGTALLISFFISDFL